MKIYFCDGCNASIPLADIQGGQVTAIKGKLFCKQCLPPHVAAPATPEGGAAEAPRGSAMQSMMFVALIGLLAWTVYRDVLSEPGADTVGEPGAAVPASLERDVAALARGVDALREELGAELRRVDLLQADLDELRDTNDGIARDLVEFRDGLDRLARGQVDAGRMVEQAQLSESRLDALDRRVDLIGDGIAALREQLQAGLADLAAGAGAGAVDDLVAAAGAVADPQRLSEIEALRKQLLDPDAGMRFDAVDKIDRGRFQELGPELVERLTDEDDYVRLHAAQTIGNLGYTEGVDGLLDMLTDVNPIVRTTARDQLVRLTGYDPGFDPRASTAERNRAIAEWRDWLASR